MTASLTQRGDLKGVVDGPEQVDAYRLLRALLGALGPSGNPVARSHSIAANLDTNLRFGRNSSPRQIITGSRCWSNRSSPPCSS